jgi:hypothetical protein
MAVLFAGIIFLTGLLIFQIAVVSRLTLLYGSSDLFILFLSAWALKGKSIKSLEFAIIAGVLVSFVSALPFYIYFVTYLGIVLIAYNLKKRVWQTPLLALAFTIIVATLVEHGLTILWLRIGGTSIQLTQALSMVSVPALLLNLLISLPVYAIISNIVDSLFPSESD